MHEGRDRGHRLNGLAILALTAAVLAGSAALGLWSPSVERHGFVSTPMWLYEAFTLLYVANYFHFEHGMLFTWDVLEERFGFGLV